LSDRDAIEELLSRTPYLIGDGDDTRVRFETVARRALKTHAVAREAAETIAEEADEILGPYEAAMRSDLVAESNRIEGYDVSAREVNDLVRLRQDLLKIEVRNFIEHIRDDQRLLESLGLYRAYTIADDWARLDQRPREFELRSLHGLVMASLDSAGAYKTAGNTIGGSEHVPHAPWDVPQAMQQLSEWFAEGTGDPVLDAAVVHAWLTHIHPFDDGNGRMARLLANLALVQAGFPPLLLRSTADRGPYLDALGSSDDGDILPLYDLFERSLRRSAKAMAKPGFVQSRIRSELTRDVRARYTMWRELMSNFHTSLEHKVRVRRWRATLMGYPSLEDFVQLEERTPDGNCWFVRLRSPRGVDEWMLWFGYRSDALCDLTGEDRPRCWPSIFVSKRTEDPRAVHPWEPVWETSDDHPVEVSMVPARRLSATIRWGYRTTDMDLVDTAAELSGTLCR
jgi:hypothetical protein